MYREPTVKGRKLGLKSIVWTRRKKETFIQAGFLRQRNMAQMKEQNKTPGKELSKEEIDNLSDAEFKTLVIRMLTEMVEMDSWVEKTQGKAAAGGPGR